MSTNLENSAPPNLTASMIHAPSHVMNLKNVRSTRMDTSTYDIYDGLVVLISCHGIKDYIVTSDYKRIDKNAIHRIFSADYPQNRTIPRLFFYVVTDKMKGIKVIDLTMKIKKVRVMMEM